MDLELPEELRLLQKTVKDFVDREIIPIEMDAMDGPVMRAGHPRRARGQGEGDRALAP